MIKKIAGIFSILLLLAAPSITFAGETETTNPNGWVDELPTDFDTDSYDVDGCFC